MRTNNDKIDLQLRKCQLKYDMNFRLELRISDGVAAGEGRHKLATNDGVFSVPKPNAATSRYRLH